MTPIADTRHALEMPVRFKVRRDLAGPGWTAYDVSSGEPVEWNGVPQVGLSSDRAREIASLLDRITVAQRRADNALRKRR